MAKNCHKFINITRKAQKKQQHTDANKLARLLNNRQPNWFIDIQLGAYDVDLEISYTENEIRTHHLKWIAHTISQYLYMYTNIGNVERIQNAWWWCASQRIMWEMCNRSYQTLITNKNIPKIWGLAFSFYIKMRFISQRISLESQHGCQETRKFWSFNGRV